MAIEFNNNILEMLQPQEVLDYMEDSQPSFTFFEKYFPTRTTQAEELIIEDETVDYHPTAVATAENAVGPNAQRFGTGKKVQDFSEFQLEYKLTKKEIRKLENPANSAERDEYLAKIYNDGERLFDAHDIVQERLRAMALWRGINELNEHNIHVGPLDYEIPDDQFVDFDFANGDFLEFYLQKNKMIRDRRKTNLGTMICTQDIVFQMMNNPHLKSAYFGTTNSQDRRLRMDELREALMGYAGLTFDIIQQPNGAPYTYNLIDGTEQLFIPESKVIFVPNGTLGETVHSPTAEEFKINEANITGVEKYRNTILYSQYITRPLNYIMTSISRFTITYPKAPSSLIVTNKSGATGTKTSAAERKK